MNSRISFALALVIFATGCAKPMYVLDLSPGLDHWAAKHPAQTQHAAPRTIEVQVATNESSGLLRDENGNSVGMVPVHGVDDTAEHDFRHQLDHANRASSGVLYPGLGVATQLMLQRHLQRYFTNVKVVLTPRETSGMTVVTPVHVTTTAGFYTRTATVQMRVQPVDGPADVSEATPEKANAAAHLAWAIPAYLATFPVSQTWIPAVFRGIYKGMEKDKVLEAIDLETANIAARIAVQEGVAR